MMKDIKFWIGLVISSVIFGVSYVMVQQSINKDKQLDQQVISLKAKIKDQNKKNQKVLYYPDPDDVDLSKQQVETIRWLNGFFKEITTWNNGAIYKQNYDMAKKYVHDDTFFKDFMTPPVSNGVNNVEATGVKAYNDNVVVLVNGADEYDVVVSYVPYQKRTDLYQKELLKPITIIVKCKGSVKNLKVANVDSKFKSNFIN